MSVAPPPRADARDLDRSLVRGIAWTGGIKWVTQILAWAATLVLARLLTPADYGLYGMATVYLGLVELVNEFGLSAAIVQRRDLDDDQIACLGGLSVLLGVVLTALSLVLAPAIAVFFGEATVRPLIMALSLTFVGTALQVLPRSLLARDLEFRKLAWLDGVTAVTQTAVTLVLAFLGYRYWALVLGALASRTVTTVVAYAFRPHRLALPRRVERVASAVIFGWQVVVARVTWYLYSNADSAIVGRVLGKASLGAYAFGQNLASIPVERISALVGRVTPAVFAAVQDNKPALQRYLRNLTEGLALITFPASAGLALLAHDLVLLALGERWRAAIMPLRLLAVYGGIRSVSTLFPQILVALGHTRRNMQFNLVATVVMPAAFLIGSRWGTTGVAVGWIVGYPLIALPLFMRSVFRLIDMPVSDYLRAMWPAVSGTLVMCGAVTGLRALLPDALPLAARFGVLALAGATAYFGTLLLAHRERVLGALAHVREMRR